MEERCESTLHSELLSQNREAVDEYGVMTLSNMGTLGRN